MCSHEDTHAHTHSFFEGYNPQPTIFKNLFEGHNP